MHPPVGFAVDGPQRPPVEIDDGFLLVVSRPRGYKNVAVACEAVGTDLSVSIKYPTTMSVVTMATRRPNREALRVTSLTHAAHKSPGVSPAVA